MKFTGQFVGVKLDLQNYKGRLDAYLQKRLYEAIGVWLQTIAGSGGRLPLWSGMARASLLEVAQLVNGRIVLSPLKAKSRIPEGKSLGTAQPIIENAKINVRIETDVAHYNLQEYKRVQGRGSPTAPWRTRQAGLAAFRASIQDVTLPPPDLKPIVHKVT